MVEILSIYQQTLSFTQTTDAIANKRDDEIIDLQLSQFSDFQHIFTQALAKLELCLSQLIKNLLPPDKSNPVSAMLNFISTYQPLTTYSHLASPAEKLSMDFFFAYQPEDYFPRQFLFGTPSQKRHLPEVLPPGG